jgi:2-dehydro-3-deoxygluconokinase
MKTVPEIVGIGECLIEFNQTSPHVYQQALAGDVTNTLFYASRLGRQTGFISTIGDDPFSEDILDFLKKERIDQSLVVRVSGKPNGIYFIQLDNSGEPSFSFRRSDSAARELFDHIDIEKIARYILAAKVFHFSAIPLAILKRRDRLFELLELINGKVVISFDTNVRKSIWTNLSELVDLLPKLSHFVNTIFVTETDDEALFGVRDTNSIFQFYSNLGYQNIILKQGAKGAAFSQDGKIVSIPTPKDVNVLDATGAGDAFNAGFLHGMLQDWNPMRCVSFGNAVAACAIQERGGIALGFDKALAMQYFDEIERSVRA